VKGVVPSEYEHDAFEIATNNQLGWEWYLALQYPSLSAGTFGISGTTFADAYQPGHLAGSLTQLQLVGPGSPNPGALVYNAQYNTFLPGVGLSWAIGKESKTVFRAGYAMSSDRNSLRNADVEVGSNNPFIKEDLSGTRSQPSNRGQHSQAARLGACRNGKRRGRGGNSSGRTQKSWPRWISSQPKSGPVEV